jgi:hypothetical protein
MNCISVPKPLVKVPRFTSFEWRGHYGFARQRIPMVPFHWVE